MRIKTQQPDGESSLNALYAYEYGDYETITVVELVVIVVVAIAVIPILVGFRIIRSFAAVVARMPHANIDAD